MDIVRCEKCGSIAMLPEKIGRYEVDSLLGQGAMGAVFKAHDPAIKRVVAIKTIRAEAVKDQTDPEQFRSRFFNEAKVCGVLNHPNIVAIYDMGEQDGSPFIAMEYLEGRTLQSIIKKERRPDLGMCAHILCQVADALDFAHERRIIHRDIKPHNIMVCRNGVTKIMDFGIAKTSDTHLTKTGFFVGTPSYSSPEQIAGEQVDHRSDIFSLGVVAHELLTGHLPFPGHSINTILYQVVNEQPTLDHVPQEIDGSKLMFKRVFFKVLAKNREKRYQSAREFTDDLRELIANAQRKTSEMPSLGADAPTAAHLSVQAPRDEPAPPRPTDTRPPMTDAPDSWTSMEIADKGDATVASSPDTLDRLRDVYCLPQTDGPSGPPFDASLSPLSSEPTPVGSAPTLPPIIKGSTPSATSVYSREKKGRGMVYAMSALVLVAVCVVAYILFRPGEAEKKPTTPEVTEVEIRQIDLFSTPAGAEVFVNGKVAGTTPLTHRFALSSEDPVQLTFRLPGYQDYQETLDPGETWPRRLRARLEGTSPSESSEPDTDPVPEEPEQTEPVTDNRTIERDRPEEPTAEEPEPVQNQRDTTTESSDIAQARQRDWDAWQRASALNSSTSYEAYLNAFPNGLHRQKATERLNELKMTADFEAAKKANTRSALESFLVRHPNSPHENEVRQRLTQLQQISQAEQWLTSNDIPQIEAFIESHKSQLSSDQRVALQNRVRDLRMQHDEESIYRTLLETGDLDGIARYKKLYGETHPKHAADLSLRAEAAITRNKGFLVKNLRHRSKKKYRPPEKESGLELKFKLKDNPDFKIDRVDVMWRIDLRNEEPIQMLFDDGAYVAHIPNEKLKEGTLKYFFRVTSGATSYDLNTETFSTEIQDPLEKGVVTTF